MRAVNLIPADEQRGAGGTAGRSGGAVYVLLGTLAVLLLVATMWTLEKRSVADKREELASTTAQAASSEARAAELQSFVQFAALRASRTQTVTSLASSRFDWSHALEELARVIPSNVSLSALQGTVAPGVALKAAAGGAAGGLRSALPVPAIELTGCTSDQDSVARMMTRMRLIDGVTRVALQSSVKADAAQGGGGVGATAAGCGTSGKAPTFALVVYFDQAAGSVPTSSGGAGRVSAAQFTPGGATGATGPSTGVTAP